MNPWLSSFSDWTLALLPRLFVYPGGLWALFALAGLRLASGGPSAFRLRLMLNDLFRSQPATATAWAVLALMPLPGATPLPLPADRFALSGLLITSLALDWHSRRKDVAHASAEIAIVLAVIAPLAQGDALLATGAGWGLSGWLSLAAVAVGLCLLSTESAWGIVVAMRRLAWLGLAAAPLWALSEQWLLPGIYGVSLVYALSIVLLGGLDRVAVLRVGSNTIAAILWGLAGLCLLVALLR